MKPVRRNSDDRLRAGLRLGFAAVVATTTIAGTARGADSSAEQMAGWFSSSVRRQLHERAALERQLESLPELAPRQHSTRIGYHSRLLKPDETVTIQLDLKAEWPIDSVVLFPARVDSAVYPNAGYGFPRRFRVEAARTSSFEGALLVADETERDVENPGDFPWQKAVARVPARFLRLTVTGASQRRPDERLVALAEIMVLSGNRNVAAQAVTSSTSSIQQPPTWATGNLNDGITSLGSPVDLAPSPSNGFLGRHTTPSEQLDAPRWVQVDLGRAAAVEEVRLVPARPADWPDTDIGGLGFPVRFKVELASDETFSVPNMLFDSTERDFANPGECPVTISFAAKTGRFVRITGTKLWSRAGGSHFGFAEVQVYSGDSNVALGKRVSASDEYRNPVYPRWAPEFLVDGYASQRKLVELPDWLAALEARQRGERRLRSVAANLSLEVAAVWRRLIRFGTSALAIIASGVAVAFWRQRRAQERRTEELRRQIARDLHDDIGSNLGTITLAAERAKRRPEADGGAASFEEIRRLASKTAESMHDLVWMLKSERSTANELIARMRDVAHQLPDAMTCAFDARCERPEAELPLEFVRHVHLSFREMVENVRKHSQARVVDISLQLDARQCHLVVRDDGVGCDPTHFARGNGIANLRSRASALGGSFSFESATGGGARLELHVPLPRRDRRNRTPANESNPLR